MMMQSCHASLPGDGTFQYAACFNLTSRRKMSQRVFLSVDAVSRKCCRLLLLIHSLYSIMLPPDFIALMALVYQMISTEQSQRPDNVNPMMSAACCRHQTPQA